MNGILQGPAYALAIGKYDDDDGYYLFSCDEEWQTITDTYHNTEAEAMNQGKFEYEGTLDQRTRK